MKISKSEFAARRKRLMSEMAPNSVAIIPAAREVTRSRDTEYPFRQNSDFFYLTGFQEPDGILVLIPGRRQGRPLMVVITRSSWARLQIFLPMISLRLFFHVAHTAEFD